MGQGVSFYRGRPRRELLRGCGIHNIRQFSQPIFTFDELGISDIPQYELLSKVQVPYGEKLVEMNPQEFFDRFREREDVSDDLADMVQKVFDEYTLQLTIEKLTRREVQSKVNLERRKKETINGDYTPLQHHIAINLSEVTVRESEDFLRLAAFIGRKTDKMPALVDLELSERASYPYMRDFARKIFTNDEYNKFGISFDDYGSAEMTPQVLGQILDDFDTPGHRINIKIDGSLVRSFIKLDSIERLHSVIPYKGIDDKRREFKTAHDKVKDLLEILQRRKRLHQRNRGIVNIIAEGVEDMEIARDIYVTSSELITFGQGYVFPPIEFDPDSYRHPESIAKVGLIGWLSGTVSRD